MNISRLLIISMVISLVACATSNGSFENPQYEQKCNYKNHKDPNDPGFKRTDIFITKETNESKKFFEPDSSKINSGIESFELDKNSIILKINNTALYEEYSAPLVLKLLETQYDARPILGVFGSIGTLGILPIMAPRALYETTFGCTDTVVYSKNIDSTKKMKTGKIEWRGYSQPHKISISGFDKEYTFDIKYNLSNKIDITEPILNTELTNSTSLKITCLDCSLKNITELNSANDIKTSIQLNYDFRPIKSSLIEAKRKAMELQQTEKSNLKTTESTNISEHTLDPAIEKAKETCLSLGFKNEKLGNCVLKLTK